MAKRYATVAELPESVKNQLPAPALATYLARYNSAYEEYGDDKVADILAWESVKLQYVKKGSNWERRQTLSLAQAVKPICTGKCLEPGKDCASCTRLNTLSEIDLSDPAILPTGVRTWVDSAYVGSWIYEGRPLKVTDKTLADFVAAFRGGRLGNDPPVDINHYSMPGPGEYIPALDTRAVGHIKDMKLAAVNTPVATSEDNIVVYEMRTHLFTLVEWNDEGWDLVSNRRFRYISPAFDTNHEDQRSGERVGPVILGVAITNTPFLTGLAPIVASKRSMTVAKTTDGKVVQGGRKVEELIGLVKTQALTFDALVSKLTAAGVAAAREVSAFLLLIVSGKIPADAANAPVAVADLESIGAKTWADELTAAGTPTVTLNAPAEAEIPKVVEALKAVPVEGEKPPAQAPPAASEASATGAAKSKTVTKTEVVKVEMTRDGKSETITLGRGDQLLAEREELKTLRKERLESKIVELARSNKDGYGFPPVVVEMTRAFLNRIEGGPVKLTKDVTEPDASAAFLRVLTEVRDRGLVKLSEQAATASKPGGEGKVIEGLGYGPENVPEIVMARYKAQQGDTVTAEDVCVAELMLSLMKADPKLDVGDAKRRAEAAVAAVTDSQEN